MQTRRSLTMILKKNIINNVKKIIRISKKQLLKSCKFCNETIIKIHENIILNNVVEKSVLMTLQW